MISLISVLIASSVVGANPPSIAVVGPEAGPGSRARDNVEEALAARDDVDVIELLRWKQAAHQAGLRGREALSRAAVSRVASAAGVDAVLVLTPPDDGEPRLLAVLLVDATGRELWNGKFPLSGAGALGKNGAVALAGKMAELVQRPAPPPPESAEPPRPGATPPLIAVLGPEAGPGSRARSNVEEALAARDDVDVVELLRWKQVARRAGLRGRAALSPTAVSRVAPGAGVDAVLVLTPPAHGESRQIAVLLVDATGRELWSGKFPLSGAGALGKTGAATLAGRVAELVQRPAPPTARPTPPPEQPPPPPAELPPTPLPSLAQPSVPAKRSEPWLRVALGMPVTWRTSSVSPTTGPGYSYDGTGTPYVGVDVSLGVAPVRAMGLTGWLAPFEIDLEASQRFASLQLSGTSGKLSADEQRLSADLAYRIRLDTGTLIGARVGYGLHRFRVDPNPVMPTSRRVGVRVGVDVGQRLFQWLAFEAGGRLFPGMGPGRDERDAFGIDGTGWGYQIVGALEGPVKGGFGWRIAYDLIQFKDSYSGAGATASGGGGSATYHTATLALTYER